MSSSFEIIISDKFEDPNQGDLEAKYVSDISIAFITKDYLMYSIWTVSSVLSQPEKSVHSWPVLLRVNQPSDRHVFLAVSEEQQVTGIARGISLSFTKYLPNALQWREVRGNINDIIYFEENNFEIFLVIKRSSFT